MGLDSSGGNDSPRKPDFCEMKKYTVFEENLKEVMKVIGCTSFTMASLVGFRVSQPLQRKQPVGSLLIAGSILTTGSIYAKMSAFTEMLRLQFFF